MSDNTFTIQDMDMAACGFGAKYAKSMIPAFEPNDSQWLVPVNPGYCFDNVDALRMMYQSWSREWTRPDHRHRKGIFFSGDTGCGKTSFVEQYFARINVPLLRTTWNPKREAEDMVHTTTLVDGMTLVQDQNIAIAAKLGLPVLINEIDLAEPGELMALADIVEQGLITLPSGKSFIAKRGFVVYCTGNTAGSDDEAGIYHGTRSQNTAFLRRFFHVQMSYPSEEADVEFLKEALPDASDGILESAARVAKKIRDAFNGTADKDRLSAPISRPELLDWVEMMHNFSPLKKQGVKVAEFALDMCFSRRLSESDRTVVHSILENNFEAGGQ